MSFFFVRSSDRSAPPSSIASSSSASLSTSSSSHTHTRRRHRRRDASPSPQRQSSWYSLMPATIPDLRLEQSYLATVRGFIHELSPEEARREKEEASATGEGGRGGGGGGDFVASGRIGGAQKEGEEGHGEPELWIGRLRIDWLPLLHVTLRDQIFSTLGSGIFWAVINVFAGQARGYVGGYVGGYLPSWKGMKSKMVSLVRRGSTATMASVGMAAGAGGRLGTSR